MRGSEPGSSPDFTSYRGDLNQWLLVFLRKQDLFSNIIVYVKICDNECCLNVFYHTWQLSYPIVIISFFDCLLLRPAI